MFEILKGSYLVKHERLKSHQIDASAAPLGISFHHHEPTTLPSPNSASWRPCPPVTPPRSVADNTDPPNFQTWKYVIWGGARRRAAASETNARSDTQINLFGTQLCRHPLAVLRHLHPHGREHQRANTRSE